MSNNTVVNVDVKTTSELAISIVGILPDMVMGGDAHENLINPALENFIGRAMFNDGHGGTHDERMARRHVSVPSATPGTEIDTYKVSPVEACYIACSVSHTYAYRFACELVALWHDALSSSPVNHKMAYLEASYVTTTVDTLDKGLAMLDEAFPGTAESLDISFNELGMYHECGDPQVIPGVTFWYDPRDINSVINSEIPTPIEWVENVVADTYVKHVIREQGIEQSRGVTGYDVDKPHTDDNVELFFSLPEDECETAECLLRVTAAQVSAYERGLVPTLSKQQFVALLVMLSSDIRGKLVEEYFELLK